MLGAVTAFTILITQDSSMILTAGTLQENACNPIPRGAAEPADSVRRRLTPTGTVGKGGVTADR